MLLVCNLPSSTPVLLRFVSPRSPFCQLHVLQYYRSRLDVSAMCQTLLNASGHPEWLGLTDRHSLSPRAVLTDATPLQSGNRHTFHPPHATKLSTGRWNERQHIPTHLTTSSEQQNPGHRECKARAHCPRQDTAALIKHRLSLSFPVLVQHEAVLPLCCHCLPPCTCQHGLFHRS